MNKAKMSVELCGMLIVLLIGVSITDRVMAAVEKPTTKQKTCLTSECHADYDKKAYVHGPVGLGDCQSCHESKDAAAHTFDLARSGRDLCESCHLDQMTGKNVHAPLEDDDCTLCHDPHSSENKALLTESTVADLCQQCHDVAEDAKFKHGPVAVGECSLCHNAHSSDHKGLLTADPSKLCVSCHVVTKNELEKFEFIHEPVKDDCTGCHDPHGADNAQMLKAQAPQLCYPCHEETKKLAETSKYKHSAINKKGGCLECHTPHASTVKFILKNDPMTLCMTCHDKPMGISQDEVLPAFTKELENKKFLHGPVAQKDCNGCHRTHGSEHFRLLVREYPPLFYAPFSEKNYDLCFGCHPNTMVLNEKTVSLTDFRNGSRNLHFLHVNKDRRGRTCRSCHQTHASNQPKHIRESVPYGMWDLPVGFSKTETGGSCTSGCHVTKDYDRENPVDYSAPVAKKTEEKPDKKKEPEEEPEKDEGSKK